MKNTTYYTEYSPNSSIRIKDSNKHISSVKNRDVRKFTRTWNGKNTWGAFGKQNKICNQRSLKTQRNHSVLM